MKKTFNFLTVILLFALSFCFSMCRQSGHWQEMHIALDKYVEFWNTANFDGIENVLDKNFEVRMTPEYEPEKGIEVFKNNVIKWRTAYPDFHITVNEKLFGDNHAAGIWTITATNSGEGWHAPTGKSVVVKGMSIIHFINGKIKDEWIASNNASWMQQLGFRIVSPFEKKEQ